ncbi:MAG: hypothetical protein ABI467_22150 [Kofleriaceae bacterium]
MKLGPACGALAVLAAFAACGTPPPEWGPDGGTCIAYASDPGFDLTAPMMSFKANVMPVLTASCSSASCHGIANGAQGGLFLGAELAQGTDAAKVFTSLVGPMAGELGTMPYVTASDPDHSFVMHKLDGDQCMLAARCTNQTCNDTMPRDGQLPVETRDILRRWIAQGAQNN